MIDTPKPLTSAELADLKAKGKAAPFGRWNLSLNVLSDVLLGNGLIARISGRNPAYDNQKDMITIAQFIAAANPETMLRLIAMIARRDAEIWEKAAKIAADTGNAFAVNGPHTTVCYQLAQIFRARAEQSSEALAATEPPK